MSRSDPTFEEIFAAAAKERQRRWDALAGPWALRWKEALVLKNISWSDWITRMMGACVYLRWGPEAVGIVHATLSRPELTEEEFNAAMAILNGQMHPAEYFQCLLEPAVDFHI